MNYLAIGIALLGGFALGFKIAQVIAQPVLDDYERLLRREALRELRGAGP